MERLGIAVSDGGSSDITYATTLGTDYPGGTGGVDGASRIPDGTGSWVRNDPSGAGLPDAAYEGLVPAPGIAYHTPGAPNAVEPDLPTVIGYGDFIAESGDFTPEELADPNVSDPFADPDRDGLPNVLEAVLGTPLRAAGGAGVGLVPAPEPGRVSIRFTLRPIVAFAFDIVVTSDLAVGSVGETILARRLVDGTWEAASGTTIEQLPRDDGLVDVVIDGAAPLPEQAFVRLSTPALGVASAVEPTR